MILVDTSIWIEHLRTGLPRLVALLDHGEVLAHDMVIGELALGSIRSREALLEALDALPGAVHASAGEALHLIDSRSLHGSGIGLVDVHLLASVLLTPGARLWTGDRRLDRVAGELSLSFGPG